MMSDLSFDSPSADELCCTPFSFAKVPLQRTRCGAATFMSDLPTYAARDRVFPIFDDEGLYVSDVASSVVVARGARSALDLGTGCGVVAMTMASHVREVVATDINMRAVTFARANVHNSALRNVQVKPGDLFDAVRRSRFDFISMNPPFLAVPPGSGFHVAGNGGADGTDIIRRLVATAYDHLNLAGALLFSAVSLVSKGSPLVLDIARRALPGDVVLDSMPVYPDDLPLDSFLSLFEASGPDTRWASELRRNYDSLRYILVLATRSRSRSNLHSRPLRNTAFSGSWTRRLARYRLWLGH